MKKDKIKSKKFAKIRTLLIPMGFAVICGIIIALFLESLIGELSPGKYIGTFFVLLALLYFSYFLQIIIHEAGHLFFGLMTGYRFSSFRIGNFMWIKDDNGKLILRRYSLQGTGGQCLMVPPDMADGKIPFVLYNLGGSMFNVISAPVFWGLYYVLKNVYFVSMFFLFMSIFGIVSALINAIPLRIGAVDNDGRNAYMLRNNPVALHDFWVQLKVNEATSKNIRIKDMPGEWFTVPDKESISNSLTATTAVFSVNRFMDMHQFSEASALIDDLLGTDKAMIPLLRNLLICDRIFCELIEEKDNDFIEELRTEEYINFIKQMRNNPSVIRTEYAYALLFEKNADQAQKIEAQFEKRMRTYPYLCEVESERELMDIAAGKAMAV